MRYIYYLLLVLFSVCFLNGQEKNGNSNSLRPHLWVQGDTIYYESWNCSVIADTVNGDISVKYYQNKNEVQDFYNPI